MALPLCDSSEAVERAAATISQTRSSGSDSVVAGHGRLGHESAPRSSGATTWKALESGGCSIKTRAELSQQHSSMYSGLPTQQSAAPTIETGHASNKVVGSNQTEEETMKTQRKVAEHQWTDSHCSLNCNALGLLIISRLQRVVVVIFLLLLA